MSPVTRTNASTPAQRSLRAVTGVIENTSMLDSEGGEGGEVSASVLGVATLSPASVDGLGVFGGSWI